MAENAFLYDGSLCMVCRGCQIACKQWNMLPAEKTEFFAQAGGYQNPSSLSPSTWNLIKFYEVPLGDRVEWLFQKHACFHCTDAACIKACPVEPVKAMTRHPIFGTVYVNEDLCIGCGACQDSCPFGVPHVDPKTEKSRKCTGCVDRVANGLLPACAATCPSGATRYGPRDEMLALAEARSAELTKLGYHPVIYGATQLEGLHSIYVLPQKLENYPDLPPNPKVPKELGAVRELMHLPTVSMAAMPLGLRVVGLERLRQRRNELAGTKETERDQS